LATELLSKCGVKGSESVLKELSAWAADSINGDRALQLRARGADFLEKCVIEFSDRAL